MQEPWYKNGIRFECQWPACTFCCHGYVADGVNFAVITPEEIKEAAEYLGLSVEAFTAEFVSAKGKAIKAVNQKCALYGSDGECRIYEKRPKFCRSFPFVPERLCAKETFERFSLSCPGIGKGRLHTREEIESMLRLT
jgi:Fe-S-cluster containining protein